MQAFAAAEGDVPRNMLKRIQRLDVPAQFAASFIAGMHKTNPEYFSDLPLLPAAPLIQPCLHGAP